MVIPSFFQYLLTDEVSLGEYMRGNFPSFNDISTRLFVKVREENRLVPDHYYKLANKLSFANISSLALILTKGISNFTADFLEISGDKVIVKHNKLNEWQSKLPYFPPLLAIANVLRLEKQSHAFMDEEVFFKKFILPNTLYSGIPSPTILQFEKLVTDWHGLHDLHMHLNGSIEIDHAWLDFVKHPRKVYFDMCKASFNKLAREQIEQEYGTLQPLTYYRLLLTARKLRRFFYEFIKGTTSGNDFGNRYDILSKVIDPYEVAGPASHPFAYPVIQGREAQYSLAIETTMYIVVLEELELRGNEVLASLFHFYLLILGMTNRLLVLQNHQNGFQQFQKITANKLRDSSEHVFKQRFLQISGNSLKNLRFLEGRFSPPSTSNELYSLLNRIIEGWSEMITERSIRLQQNYSIGCPELKLVAHFIKKEDTEPDQWIRHKKLRFELWLKAKVLAIGVKNHPKYRQHVTGIDAAASEFDAPPEVFAPVYRYLRHKGFRHFTYHAGEDFYHLIGGLRAIYEAIVFCNLKAGDRIGHAVATAIDPMLWINVIGDNLQIREGDYLDDLVFVRYLIIHCHLTDLQFRLPFVESKIINYFSKIYHDHANLDDIEKAWLLRQCCPLHILNEGPDNIYQSYFNDEEKYFAFDAGFLQSGKKSQVIKLFEHYHSLEFRKNYDNIVTIQATADFSVQEITQLQRALLEWMTNKEIVIETLPTSNVRIGFHRDFKTFHLYRWLTWKKEGKKIPPIVVGSDDTGIFATSIYNEYANIYESLIYHADFSQDTVINVIKKFNENSRTYRFD